MAWPWQNGWSEGCQVCVTKGESQTEARHWDWRRWTGIKLRFAGEERDVGRGKLLWTQISSSHWTLSHMSTLILAYVFTLIRLCVSIARYSQNFLGSLFVVSSLGEYHQLVEKLRDPRANWHRLLLAPLP